MDADTAPIDVGIESTQRSTLLGCLVFPLVVLGLPTLAVAANAPIELTPVGRWVFVVGTFALCVRFATRGVRPDARRTAFHSFLKRSSITIALLAILFLLSLSASGCTTTVSETPSPDGNLVLVHTYYDQGGLGGDDVISVRGSIVPGLLRWDYQVGHGDYPVPSHWVDADTVTIGYGERDLPWAVVHLSW